MTDCELQENPNLEPYIDREALRQQAVKLGLHPNSTREEVTAEMERQEDEHASQIPTG